MRVINESGLTAGWCVGRVPPHALSATLIVKGTFTLVPGGPAVPAGEQLPLDGDVHEDGDPRKPLAYASDFAWFKPRADILVAGAAHVPEGKPNIVCSVAARIGTWSKRLAVVGDRMRTTKMLMFTSDSEPVPFVKRKLSYAFSYGGAGYAKNPSGLGHADVTTAEGRRYRPLPNIIDYDALQSDPVGREPAGFGPYPVTWPQRGHKTGTYDAAWLKARWPGFPDDFDWGFFNAAPRDQQCPYLRGDEKILLENLSAERPVLESRLPGVRPRWFVHEREGNSARMRQATLNLDTVWIDAEAGRLVLVWRGVLDIRDRKMRGIAEHFVVSEPLAESRPQEHYAALLEKARGPAAVAAPVRPAGAAVVSATWTRERCVAHAAAKGDFSGLDLRGLDLSGVDLSGRTCRGVLLERAKLAGAGLAKADLTGAFLAGADLGAARAAGAVLAGADLAGASLAGADLSNAVIDRADFTRAKLAGAKLDGASARGANFFGADLAGARLEGAMLAGAEFGESVLTKAVLVKAQLVAASAGKAKLMEADLRGADVTKFVATGADLTKAVANEMRGDWSVWEGAKLDEANLTRASLPHAVFESVSAKRAVFSYADLRQSTFAEAHLERANLLKVNLFRASLEAAFLTGAQFAGANLHEAELHEAMTESADFRDAILTGTKLA